MSEDWIKTRQLKLQKQKEENSQFFKFPEGETEILIDTAKPPEEVISNFGKPRTRYNITIVKTGAKKIIDVGVSLDSLIIEALMSNVNPMTVIRTGTDLKTKYGIKGF